MIVRAISLLLLTITIVGCAATGPMYSEEAANRPKSPETAQVTIYRTGDHVQYSARAVRLTLDKNVIGNVDYKGFNIFDVEAGQHTLTADMWDAPGKCDVVLNLLPATEYYLQVLPRSGSLASGLVGGVLGMAIESGGKECGGAFAITPVAKETALNALQPLRLTK
ncbi:MAG: hypothetical protein ACAH09_06600 [Methylophilaceae bacterium]|jgi:phage baseplate assembly protein gpV|nr:hypothetical protein [Methylophilaceae bacterium]